MINTMKLEEFEDKMRKQLYRTPFVPFEVEMEDGRVVIVDNQFAMNAGLIAFFSQDDALVDIACEDVKCIRPLSPQYTQ